MNAPKLQHPNRRPFEGVLTFVDQPSDRAPSGSRKHLVVLTRAAALEAIPSLVGMAVAFKAGWDGHDARRKCGVITSARLAGDRLLVAGYLYDCDFPEVSTAIAALQMGMSYELRDAHVEDMGASVWILTKVTFTGAAILLREKAAYCRTEIRMVESEADAEANLLSDGSEDLLQLSSGHAPDGLLPVEVVLDMRLGVLGTAISDQEEV